MSVITSLVAQDLIFTSLLVILTSCIASFYYIRLIKVVSFTNSYRNNEWILANSRNTEIIVCSFSMLALLFIFRSNFFVSSSYLISALLV
jgi:NADH:ubiquinone oxidoreductase subunit 2 (subunit N)